MKKLIALFVLLFAMAILPGQSAFAKEGKDCCKKGEACEKPLAGKKAGAQKSCAACAKICEDTLKYFKKQGGKYTEAANLQKLQDCITLCNASADLQARNSAHA